MYSAELKEYIIANRNSFQSCANILLKPPGAHLKGAARVTFTNGAFEGAVLAQRDPNGGSPGHTHTCKANTDTKATSQLPVGTGRN